MSADDSLDQQPSLQAVLTARYPSWTIWFGKATRHWWALPPHERSIEELVEARSVDELVESIRTTTARLGPSQMMTRAVRPTTAALRLRSRASIFQSRRLPLHHLRDRRDHKGRSSGTAQDPVPPP